MAASDRPGGLTAIAVVNFLLAAGLSLALLGVLVNIGALLFVSERGGEAENAELQELLGGLTPTELATFFAIYGVWLVIEVALLAITGVGYLGQKRVLGRWIGNVYGVLGIVCTILVVEFLPPAITGGEGYTIGAVTGMFYPAFTLVLLNLVFRRDFRR